MTTFLQDNNIVRNGFIMATVNSDGTVTRYTSARLPIRLLQQAGARADIIEAIREADRRHEVSRRSRGTRTVPVVGFNTTRTFGVELECYCPSNEQIRRDICLALADIGISCKSEHYNHTDHIDYWKIVNDGSLSGENSFELVSPILKGNDGIEQISKVCAVLHTLSVKVNRSCGMHVHHDARDLDIAQLFHGYRRNELIIDELVPQSRRGDNSRWCHSLRNTTLRGWKNDRYFKVNYQAYLRHNTIEFRQHSGTIEANKIIAWVKLTQAMVENTATFNQSFNSVEELASALGLNPEWYVARAAQLARTNRAA